jgi:NAD(P)-dependent dehydrogenase (short-subunit alcohol dehydrogenase family)
MTRLDGKVVALVCRGSDGDRAIAVALAEAGANLALGTVTPAEEFATASIANEVWAIGHEQFNIVLDAADPVAVASFAEEVCERLGRCDGLVIATGPVASVDFDELSRDEWNDLVSQHLTAVVVAVQAFARVIERGGGGKVALIVDPPAPTNVAGEAIGAAARSFAQQLSSIWKDRPLVCTAFDRGDSPEEIVNALG